MSKVAFQIPTMENKIYEMDPCTWLVRLLEMKQAALAMEYLLKEI